MGLSSLIPFNVEKAELATRRETEERAGWQPGYSGPGTQDPGHRGLGILYLREENPGVRGVKPAPGPRKPVAQPSK